MPAFRPWTRSSPAATHTQAVSVTSLPSLPLCETETQRKLKNPSLLQALDFKANIQSLDVTAFIPPLAQDKHGQTTSLQVANDKF